MDFILFAEDVCWAGVVISPFIMSIKSGFHLVAIDFDTRIEMMSCIINERNSIIYLAFLDVGSFSFFGQLCWKNKCWLMRVFVSSPRFRYGLGWLIAEGLLEYMALAASCIILQRATFGCDFWRKRIVWRASAHIWNRIVVSLVVSWLVS